MFRSITKLNNGVEAMGKQSEVYRLKLLNAEMKTQLTKLLKEKRNNELNAAVESIISLFSREKSIAESTDKCLRLLEEC